MTQQDSTILEVRVLKDHKQYGRYADVIDKWLLIDDYVDDKKGLHLPSGTKT